MSISTEIDRVIKGFHCSGCKGRRFDRVIHYHFIIYRIYHRLCPWFCCALFCCGYLINHTLYNGCN